VSSESVQAAPPSFSTQHHEVEQGDGRRDVAALVQHPLVDEQGAAGGQQADGGGHDCPAALRRVVVEHAGEQDGVPALGGRAAEAGPVEVAIDEGQLGMAFAEDRLDLGQVEHGGLQAGDGPGQGGGVGAGAAADVEQPPRPGQAGQGGQLAPEPGGQVVEGAEEAEGLAGVGGEALAPGRDAGVAVADAVGRPAQAR
jgi:hypothetical protein